MIPTRYGVTSLRHGPGAALVLASKTLYFSAHWLTVKSSGGLNTAKLSLIQSGQLLALFGIRTIYAHLPQNIV